MRILLDTNVVLDVLLQREPWSADAEPIWRAAAEGRLECCITSSSLTDLFYISRRVADGSTARTVVRNCLDLLDVLPVDRDLLEEAFALAAIDFEDAVQIAAAAGNQLDAIITRDPRGFADSPVAVLSPVELNERLVSEAS